MPTEIHLAFEQKRALGGCTNTLAIHHPKLRHRPAGTTEIEFLHVGDLNTPEPTVLDGYLLGALLFAMGGAERVYVNGPVSAKAIHNAHLLAEAWHSWLPNEYLPLEIIPERIVQDDDLVKLGRFPSDKTIAAFSGGLDSTFSVLRHTQKVLGNASRNITDLVMVHGFDVSLQNQADFEELVERTRPFIDDLGLNLRIVRTNIKDVLAHNWEHVFGAQLACILHQFSHEFAYGLLASGAVMSEPDIRWGSSPQLDYLLSGGAMEIIHDGAGKSRTDKAALVAQNPIARRSVKVCWEGSKQGQNCGVCEKCVRTRLNFMAAGKPDPECFDTPFRLDMLDTLTAKNLAQLNLLKEIVRDSERYGTASAWVSKLEHRIAQHEVAFAAPASSIRKNTPNPMIERMQAHQHALQALLHRHEPLWLLTEMPGNIGDHLIWAGTERMLLNSDISFQRLPKSELLSRITSHAERPNPNGSLLVPGNAACTRHWNEWLPDLIYAASPLFSQVIILPSEYEPTIPTVSRALSLKNVLPFAREPDSYKAIKRFGKASLSLDLALWAFDFISPQTSSERYSTLLALRTDAGSLLPEMRLQPASYNDDISLTCKDLDEFIARIQGVDAVVTDRLHVAVAAIMLGKQVHYVDPYCNKISRYARYTFRGEFDQQLHQHDEDWLLAQGYAVEVESMK